MWDIGVPDVGYKCTSCGVYVYPLWDIGVPDVGLACTKCGALFLPVYVTLENRGLEALLGTQLYRSGVPVVVNESIQRA